MLFTAAEFWSLDRILREADSCSQAPSSASDLPNHTLSTSLTSACCKVLRSPNVSLGFPGGGVVKNRVKILLYHCGKESACQGRKCRRHRFDPWVGKIPWRREWLPTPVLLLGESHGKRSLGGCSPWSCRELNKTKQLNTHTHCNVYHTFDLFPFVSFFFFLTCDLKEWRVIIG